MSGGTRFDGKTVLVTGAGSGIGLATVDRLLSEGAKVCGLDLNEPAREDGSDRYLAVAADVRDEDATRAAVAATVEAFGRLDGAVTSAGVAGGGPVHLVEQSGWDQVISINLTGTFLTAKHAITQFLEQEPVDGERGSVVTLASVEGIEGTAGGSSYNASKGGVVLLTKNMAIDYGPAGIRVNAICPGFIDTPLCARCSWARTTSPRASCRSTSCAASVGRRRSPASRPSSVVRRVVRHRAGDRRRRWLHRGPRSRPHRPREQLALAVHLVRRLEHPHLKEIAP